MSIAGLALALVFTGCSKDKTGGDASTEYGVLTKVGDKLYEVTFDEYAEDHEEANRYYSNEYGVSKASECTCIYKDGSLMRNLDWYIRQDGVDICETVIRTTANEGRYATLGVMKNAMVTDDTYDKLSENQLKMLPFALTDGINSEGLMFGQNACPVVDGISNTIGTNPEGEDLSCYMLGRDILDYCASVDEAIEYLKTKNCYFPNDGRQTIAEAHFLVADKERAAVIEFVDNKITVVDQTFCTNHYLFNGGANTGHGSGYERDKIITENYASVTDWQTGMALLEKLKYSQIYTLPFGDEFWYSEFYEILEIGGTVLDFNCNSPIDDPLIQRIINFQIEAYGRLEDDCWWTSHSSVYDAASRTLHLALREDYDKIYSFSLWPGTDID